MTNEHENIPECCEKCKSTFAECLYNRECPCTCHTTKAVRAIPEWAPLDPNNINPENGYYGSRLHNAIMAVYKAGNYNAEDDDFADAREEVFAAADELLTTREARVREEMHREYESELQARERQGQMNPKVGFLRQHLNEQPGSQGIWTDGMILTFMQIPFATKHQPTK